MEETAAVTRLDCGCVVCNDCLREYAVAEVMERGRADIPCPSCDKLMDELTLTELLQWDAKDVVPFRKYQVRRQAAQRSGNVPPWSNLPLLQHSPPLTQARLSRPWCGW